MQIAQAALAILYIGFDQIARLASTPVPLLALRKFCGDELGCRALHNLPVEARDQFVVERLIAGEESRLQHGRADRHVAPRLADRLIDRTRRVTDLQPHVPEAIKDRFRDLLTPRGLLVGQDEQQIDIGFRRHQSAAVTARGNDRHNARYPTTSANDRYAWSRH